MALATWNTISVVKALELPVTTTQDYALFNHLKKYTLTLWERQIEFILQQNARRFRMVY